MRSGSTCSSRLAIALAAILKSTFNSVIGLQLDKSNNEQSSFGVNVITPLR